MTLFFRENWSNGKSGYANASVPSFDLPGSGVINRAVAGAFGRTYAESASGHPATIGAKMETLPEGVEPLDHAILRQLGSASTAWQTLDREALSDADLNAVECLIAAGLLRYEETFTLVRDDCDESLTLRYTTTGHATDEDVAESIESCFPQSWTNCPAFATNVAKRIRLTADGELAATDAKSGMAGLVLTVVRKYFPLSFAPPTKPQIHCERLHYERTPQVAQKERPQGAGLSAEDRAIAVLIKHPEMTVSEIAKMVQCSRQYLTKCEKFKATRRALLAMNKEARKPLRGSKGKGGEIEAWEDDN